MVDPRVSATVGDRLAGIRAVLSRRPVSPWSKWQRVSSGSLSWATGLTHEILDAHPQLSGLICLNDRLAFGAYQALQERGRHIPDDISVVSFDDDEIAAYLRPQLTTARIPYEEMGRQAMAMVLDRTEDRFRRRRVPMPVQHRGSVGPPQLSASM